MNIVKKIKIKSIDPNITFASFPVVLSLLLSIVLIFVLNTGIKNISNLFSERSALQKSNIALQDKERILSNLKASYLTQSSAILTALPSENSVLLALSQLKTAAQENELAFKFQNANIESEGKISGVEINAQVTGSYEDIFNYVKTIEKQSPIIKYSLMQYIFGEDLVTLAIRMTTFYSSLPDEIPPLTQPINQLTEVQKQKLNELAGFSQPTFSNLTPEDYTDERIDPFN